MNQPRLFYFLSATEKLANHSSLARLIFRSIFVENMLVNRGTKTTPEPGEKRFAGLPCWWYKINETQMPPRIGGSTFSSAIPCANEYKRKAEQRVAIQTSTKAREKFSELRASHFPSVEHALFTTKSTDTRNPHQREKLRKMSCTQRIDFI